jgi:alpha-tubulin suppressor-like RCC1 family protein
MSSLNERFIFQASAISTRLVIGAMLLAAHADVRASSIAAGTAHSAVVKTTDNTVWTFGSGGNGRLGDGATTTRVLPVQVTSLSNVSAVAAGAAHTLFLKSDGTVWAAGVNSNGQLGDNTITQRTSPVQVKTGASTFLTGVTKIAAGGSFSLAVKSDGTVWGWGLNSSGQLGNNSTTQSNVAVQVKTDATTFLTGVTHVAAGDFHALALKSDGSVVAWGYNVNGRLGNGGTTQSNVAVPVSFSAGTVITAVAAGGSHSLAVKSDGTLWAWGNKTSGRLGDGSTSGQQLVPLEIAGVANVISIAAGAAHSALVESDGVVRTFGDNAAGQLGDGTTTDSPWPMTVSGVTNAISIVAAANHTLAVTSDGIVWAWGDNVSGQIGDGTQTEDRLTPVSISEAGYAWKVGTPTFSLAAGTYVVAASVSTTVSSATSAASIYYTLDGSEPTSSSTPYTGALTITQTVTLKARAYKASVPTSNVGTRVYELKAMAPAISPSSATYNIPQTSTMTSGTTAASIRYTTDGSEPSESSATYSTGVPIEVSATLKAKAFNAGWTPSNTTTVAYTLKVGLPSFSPVAGSYGTAQSVGVTTVTPGATLRYTESGLEPVETDAVVSGAIPVGHSLTLRARGWKAGWTTSDGVLASYLLGVGTVATPTFSPTPGTFTTAPTVTLASATTGAEIRYTLDGSDPGLQSPIFASPFTVPATSTVKARAFKADMVASAIASASYTVNTGSTDAPTISVGSGVYTTQRTVVITAATADVIRYTTTGADPVETDTSITSGGSLLVDRALILKVKAWKSGFAPSAVVRRDYVVTGAIAAGDSHMLALKADGTVWSWGSNLSGKLGRSGPTNVPGQVTGLSDVVAVVAGAGHSLALKADGTVVGWGLNTSGQIGIGSTASPQNTPVALSLTNIVAIAAGEDHSLALKSDGTVMAWGLHSSGQLGVGTSPPSPCTSTQCNSPTQISGLVDVVAIAAGNDHSLALKSDGTVVAFGEASSGQIGDGQSTTDRKSPVTVLAPAGIVRIAAGGNVSLALKADGLSAGSLWTWGANASGQLGDGTTVAQNRPYAVLSSVALAASGEQHSLALALDGRLWSWGAGTAGALGTGSTDRNPVPTYLVSSFESLAAYGGTSFSTAIAADGQVFVWGLNTSSQLGDGTTLQKTTPIPVPSFALASNGWLASDTDQDGLSNATEYRIGTDPLNPDSNGNGLPDGLELQMGSPPSLPDTDGDGLTNVKEIELGTDPNKADTDGDGVADGLDAFPLDPTQSQATPDPGDTTGPTITLQEPTNAVEQ